MYKRIYVNCDFSDGLGWYYDMGGKPNAFSQVLLIRSW